MSIDQTTMESTRIQSTYFSTEQIVSTETQSTLWLTTTENSSSMTITATKTSTVNQCKYQRKENRS